MLLGTLPPVLADELLYSLMARVHRSYRGIIAFRFLKALDVRSVGPLLPRELDRIAQVFPPGSGMDAAELLRRHSVLPYYESTAEREEVEAARAFLSGPLKKGRLTMGYKAGEGQLKHRLRSCPECVREDMAITGEAAWKRSHNLPEVYVCHRHDLALEAMTLPRREIDFIACPGPERTPLSSPHGRALTRDIAKNSNWLLTCPPRPTSMVSVKQVLRLALLGADPGWKRNGEVYEYIVQAHSAESLRLLGLPMPFRRRNLPGMMTFSRGLHPLRVMLIAHVTGHSMRSLLFEGAPSEQGLDLLWHRSARTVAKPSATTVARLREEVLGQDLSKPVSARGKVARDRLRRADPDWYAANVPSEPDVTAANVRREEDARLAAAVRDEADRLYEARPHVRVSMRKLIMALGITHWKFFGESGKPDYYPQTKLMLRLSRESGSEFRTRMGTDGFG